MKPLILFQKRDFLKSLVSLTNCQLSLNKCAHLIGLRGLKYYEKSYYDKGLYA
jgi:hypothetical protein